MTKRSAWRISSAGSLGRLALVEEDLPPPHAGEARVRVEAIGLNFADVFACLGLYSATPAGSFVPGLECAGVIESIAEPRGAGGASTPAEVADLRVGQRVMLLTRFGGYATALNAGTSYLLPVPDGWSAAEAAAFPVQAVTAWYGLVHLGALAHGHVALVHSAAGGVGLHAVAIARTLGAEIITTVGRSDKVPFLVARDVPRDRIIVRDERRFRAQLQGALEAAGADGLDVVLDAVAGPYLLPALSRLRPEGRYVIYGAADFMPAGTRPNWARLGWRYVRRPRLDPMRLIDRNRSVMGFNLIWLFAQAGRLPSAARAARALSPGVPHIGARFRFDQVPQALRALQSGRTTGKVVVEVG